ncbi:hypothetical protein ISCGN_010734 [Ixodes scapularis]
MRTSRRSFNCPASSTTFRTSITLRCTSASGVRERPRHGGMQRARAGPSKETPRRSHLEDFDRCATDGLLETKHRVKICRIGEHRRTAQSTWSPHVAGWFLSSPIAQRTAASLQRNSGVGGFSSGRTPDIRNAGWPTSAKERRGQVLISHARKLEVFAAR